MFVLSKILGFFALPSNLLFVLALARHPADGRRASARRARAARHWRYAADRGGRPVAGRQRADLAAGGAAFRNGTRAARPTASSCWAARSRRMCPLRAARLALDEAAERMTEVQSSRAAIRMRGSCSPAARPAVRRRARGGLSCGRAVREFWHRVAIASCWKAIARNTVENAVFTKALVDPKPQRALAAGDVERHMPRSVGVFRKAGFPVEPIRWTGSPPATNCGLAGPVGSFAGGLARTDAAIA